MAKLYHSFITTIEFVTIQNNPPVLFQSLAWATMGDLAFIISRQLNEVKQKPEYLTEPLFDDAFNFSFLYQVSSGMAYLHLRRIGH